MKKTPVLVAGLCAVAATSVMGMSLGRHRGPALIGQPLHISVQAVLNAQEDPALLCLEADVFYSENRLAQSRIEVVAEKPSPASLEALIHIRSSAPIDEPVITIYLRAGCQQKTERRYVVLADLASEAAPAQSLRPLGSMMGSVQTAATSSARAAPERAVDGPVLTKPGGQAGVVTRPSTRSAGRQQKLPSSAPAARLKLEPLDLASVSDPQLRASSALLTLPSPDPQQRAAAAALWAALTTQPQDIVRDAERFQALDASMRSLQLETQSNRRSIEELSGLVVQARSQRFANPLVYGLATLLLLAIAGAVYFKRRREVSPSRVFDELPWWRKNDALEKGWSSSVPESQLSSLLDVAAHAEDDKSATRERHGQPELDLDLTQTGGEVPPVALSSVAHRAGTDSIPPLSRRDRPDFALSATNPARAVKAEELFDVQQQADFFVSLGQHSQAIEVLRNHIDDSTETSALVYLDLFNLYYQLKRQADYEALRGEFNQRFNAKMPGFEFYQDSSPGLDAYQSALSRIEALWPSPKVLDVIEESIFRRPDAGTEAFDLEAYRELLLLYAVAREIISPEFVSGTAMLKFDAPLADEETPLKATKFLPTSIQPLSATVTEEKVMQTELLPDFDLVVPPASSRLGLDLDLSQFTELHEAVAPLAVSDSNSSVNSDSSFIEQFAPDAPSGEPVSVFKVVTQTNRAAADMAQTESNPIDFGAFDSTAKPATDSPDHKA